MVGMIEGNMPGSEKIEIYTYSLPPSLPPSLPSFLPPTGREELVEEALALMRQHSIHPPDVVTFNSILTGKLLRGGEPEGVLARMEEVRKEGGREGGEDTPPFSSSPVFHPRI